MRFVDSRGLLKVEGRESRRPAAMPQAARRKLTRDYVWWLLTRKHGLPVPILADALGWGQSTIREGAAAYERTRVALNG
jgi:hypothetical protein